MSDVRPPQDDRRLFENLEAKVSYHERRASDHWDEMSDYRVGDAEWKQHLRGFEYHKEMSRHARTKLRRGEREPRF